MDDSLRYKVKNYYLDNADKLSQSTRFHLGTRLAAWTGDTRALGIVAAQRIVLTDNDGDLKSVFKELLSSPLSTGVNAANEREQYFQKYPTLRNTLYAMFRARHLLTVYGIDARKELAQVIPIEELLTLENALWKDIPAIKTLSTYAINYIYLMDVLFRETPKTDIAEFFKIGETCETNEPAQLQLLIYLYTHCIIGETNFYSQIINEERLTTCIKMLQKIELLLAPRMEDMTLDTKLEFLVCTKICSYTSLLEKSINDECEKSLSDNGVFLIDKLNKWSKIGRKISFEESEHRNALYIMSGSAYSPHPMS